jgi:hypothetical protein
VSVGACPLRVVGAVSLCCRCSLSLCCLFVVGAVSLCCRCSALVCCRHASLLPPLSRYVLLVTPLWRHVLLQAPLAAFSRCLLSLYPPLSLSCSLSAGSVGAAMLIRPGRQASLGPSTLPGHLSLSLPLLSLSPLSLKSRPHDSERCCSCLKSSKVIAGVCSDRRCMLVLASAGLCSYQV